MVRFIPVLVIGLVFYFVFVQALECGIAEQMAEENLKNAMTKCAIKKSNESEEKKDKNSPDSAESSEEKTSQTYDSASRSGTGGRTRRTTFNENSNAPEGGYRRIIRKRETVSSSQGHDEDSDHSGQGSSNTTVSEKCVLQCIFNSLGLVDAKGYPEHNLVAQNLLKNAKGRELRDFIQDSTDECFQLMEQGEKLDSCEYTTHLVTCMSEKGRSNCADWQAMKLPFHH